MVGFDYPGQTVRLFEWACPAQFKFLSLNRVPFPEPRKSGAQGTTILPFPEIGQRFSVPRYQRCRE
jgi:hypothetical protein